MKIERLYRYVLAGLILLLTGCVSPPMIYNPYFVPDKRLKESDQITGKVFIYTTPSDDEKLVTAKSTTFIAGGAPPLTTQIGKITRGVALKVFRQVGTAGAEAGNSVPPDKQYAAIIRPETTKFTHGYRSLKYLGTATTAEADVELVVTLLDSMGCKRSEFFYTSGSVSSPPSFLVGNPLEDLNRLLHETLYKLYLQAASDIKKDLLNPNKPASASPCVPQPTLSP